MMTRVTSAMHASTSSRTPFRTAAPGTVRPSLATVRRTLIPIRAQDTESTVGDIKEKLVDAKDKFVEATKENSGLDFDKLNAQPGTGTGLGSNVTKDKGVQDTMSFSGLAPEIINGRAAMWAMLAAFAAEVRTGAPVFVQIQQAPVAILGAFAVIIVASLVPIVRGADLNRDGFGPFTQKAEVYNGRVAMLAFALLIAVETWKAGPGLVP